jgi:hypothetical protein
MTYPAYPLNTEKLGDLAWEIQELAQWADARLPGTGIETVSTGNVQTNAYGDIAVTFQTITNVQAVLQSVYLTTGSGAPSWMALQVPVWLVQPTSNPDMIIARCVGQATDAGAVLANAWVNVCAYGWGTPK